MKDQPPSRALPCANPLDFHVEVQGRVNTALSSLSFGWACSLAATAQLCAGSDGARRATGGVPLAGQAHGSGHCEEGAGGGLQGGCSWGTCCSGSAGRLVSHEENLEMLCPGARKVSWLLQSDFPGKGTI